MKNLIQKLSDCIAHILKKLGEADRKRLNSLGWLMTGSDDLRLAMENEDRKSIKSLKTALSGLAVLLVCSIAAGGGSFQQEIERPPYGSDALLIDAVARADWEGVTSEEQVTLQVNPRALDSELADEYFAQCREDLLKIMPGKNADLDHVCSDLELPLTIRDGAVLLSWESSRPELLSDDGTVMLLGAEDGASAELYCMMMAEEFSEEYRFDITFDVNGADKGAILGAALKKQVSSINDSEGGDAVVLPAETDGVRYSWSKPQSGAFGAVLAVGILVLAFIWAGRYEALERSLKNRKNAFEDQVQDMMTQLVLLLDAGLVLSSAFDHLLDANRNGGPLYKAMGDVKAQSDAVNAPYTTALYSYAVRTGCRDFIRFAALAEDNRTHGSELSEKLRRENSRMREHRLNRAKARSKEAETKLCMPLMLLLLALLAIAAGPVLLDM